MEGDFFNTRCRINGKGRRNGIHTLIAFKEEDWLANGNDDINNFLNQIFTGIDNRENRNTRCNLDLISTIKRLDEFNKDYFIIFAHIEQDSGFIKELGGGLIQSLVSTTEFQERVYGFQKLRTIDNIEKLKGWLGYELAFVGGHEYILPYALDVNVLNPFFRSDIEDNISEERLTNAPGPKNPTSEIMFKKGLRFEGEDMVIK